MKTFILYINLLILAIFSAQAQLITVEDTIFNEYLCDNFPLAMSADCNYLDTVKARSEYPDIDKMHLSNKGITSADEIVYFANADTINLNKNSLTSFPEDLSNFRSLTWLNLTMNKLTTAPNIKYTHPESGDTAVKHIYLKYNKISVLPDSWYEENSRTQVVDLYDNELENIPSFSNYPQIRRLDVRENRLDFEGLIPIKQNPVWDINQFDLFPQKPFFVYDTFTVNKGEDITLDISRNLASNEYYLLKDNVRIEKNKTGLFVISNIQEADTGSYWFKIHNSEFPDNSDFLASEKFVVQFEKKSETVSPDSSWVKEDDVILLSPNGDGIADFLLIEGTGEASFINKAGSLFKKEQLPYKWYGDDANGKTLKPGLYYIKMEDESFMKVLIVR